MTDFTVKSDGVIEAFAAKLVTTRAGDISVMALRTLTGSETPALTVGPHNVVKISAFEL